MKNCFYLLLIGFSIFSITCHADVHTPETIISENGMVASAHPLASSAGLSILKAGGNAVDAAVATAYALNVVEPNASGLGGGGFMVIAVPGKEPVVINYREKASRHTKMELYYENGKLQESQTKEGGKSIAVPGTVMGLETALEKYGTKNTCRGKGICNKICQRRIGSFKTIKFHYHK